MSYQKQIETMSQATYENLLRSVELGKWPDGRVLTATQRENTMQAIIAWGRVHLKAKDRVGFIDKGHKAGDICDEPEEIALNWKE